MAETERDRRRESGVPVAAIFLGVAAANRLAQAGEPRPKQAMETAAEMRAQGASERAIYRATNKILEGTEYAGVSYDAAGEPVFEASDKNVKLKGGALKSGAAYLGEVLPRPESAGGSALAGRDLVPVEIGQGTGLTDGAISLDKSYEKTLAGMKWVKGEARGALLHEEQHVGHIIEDRPAGGHPDDFREPIVALKGGKRIVTKAIPGDDAASHRVREQAYGILAGEQEAELTRASADMSAGERRAIHPDDRKYPGKVPKDKQLVVYDGGRQAMAARGLSDREMSAMKRLVAQGSGTKASTPTETVRATLARATNEQLQALDNHARAAHSAAKGNARAERIRAWKQAVGEAAKAQTSSIASTNMPETVHEDVRGVPTQIRPGADGDPFKYKSKWHESVEFDKDGYPGKTTIVHAATLEEYEAKLRAIDDARAAAGLKPRHVWDDAAREASAKARAADAKAPAVESAIDRAMRTSAERAKTTTGTLVKPALSEDAAKQAKFSRDMADVLSREAKTSLEIAAKGENAGNKLHFEMRAHEQQQTAKLYADRAAEIESGKQKFLPGPTEVDALKEKIAAHDEGVFNGKPVGWDADAPVKVEDAVKHPGTPIPPKPESTSDWLKARDERIKASKAAGNTHLDALDRSVEGMRGKPFVNVHDPKERGVVRTVANTGEVVVDWADDYSAKKNLAEATKEGKRTVHRSWLAPTDLKDYVAEKPKPKGPPRLMGIPADGSKPFVMAILDSPGDPADAAKRIYSDTARLYTQKLSGYQVEDAAGNKLVGFQNESTLNAALKAQGKAESGKARTAAEFTQTEKFRVTPKNPNSGLYELTPEYAKALVREAHAIPKSDPTRSLKIEAAQGKAHVYYDANGKFAGHRGTAALRDPNRPIELHSSTRQSLESTKAGRETLRKLGHPVEEPKSITQLKAEAKAAGIKGTSKMSKSALIEALGKGLNKAGSVAMIAAPVAAAAVAYDATRSEAKAAGASDTDATRKAMTNAAVAGGATAGVMAGVGVAAKFALTRIVPAAVAGPAGWALLGGMTAYGAYRAYQAHKDKGLGGTAAALSLIGADEALHLVKRDAGPTRLNAEQAAAYKAANARHEAMQAQAPASTNKRVGFQNPANLASAMASQDKVWDGTYGKKS